MAHCKVTLSLFLLYLGRGSPDSPFFILTKIILVRTKLALGLVVQFSFWLDLRNFLLAYGDQQKAQMIDRVK